MGRWAVLFAAVIMLLSTTNKLDAQCCTYWLSMQDSYGDGWNGGSVQVSINGAAIGTYAVAVHANDTSFTACTGDTIRLFYSAGIYEEDNTYQLFDPAGNDLFSDGPNPSTGEVFLAALNCDSTAVPGSNPTAALAIDTIDCVLANNTDAGNSGLPAGCANFQGHDIWYAAKVPPSGNVMVSTEDAGGLNDTGIAIWTGPDSHHLTRQTCDDDGGPGYFSRAIAFDLPSTDSLYIQAYGYGGATGAFQLCLFDQGIVRLDSSELPIVLINLQGQDIPYDGKVNAHMEMKYNGPGTITYLTDPSNEYDGAIGIGVRGTTSADYPQHPYNIETRDSTANNNDVSLLGMPKENDWCLLSNYNDRSFLRNMLAFHLARGMGQYAPRTALCEVLIDSVYKGVYVFAERIKRDSGRVHIAKLTGTENSGDDLTGGYILEHNLWDGNGFSSNFSPIDHPGFDVHFLYDYPAPDTITAQQKTYIASYVDSLETALYSADFADPLIGYRQFLDVPSFINYFLVNEVSRNNDGFKKSIFLHKDKRSNGGLLKMGPVWDFDWAWKDIWGCSIFEATDGSGWAHLVNDCPTDNYSSGWYVRLLQDSSFANELRCAYEDYRTTALDNANIFAYIDSVGALVANAQARHYRRWPILGVSGPAPEVGDIATSYAAELDTLKGWIAERLAWLDANIPGTCSHVGIEERGNAVLHVFPNPSDGHVRFSGTMDGVGPFALRITDVTGRVVRSIGGSAGRIALDVELPSAGVYAYVLSDAQGTVLTGKLVVR